MLVVGVVAVQVAVVVGGYNVWVGVATVVVVGLVVVCWSVLLGVRVAMQWGV